MATTTTSTTTRRGDTKVSGDKTYTEVRSGQQGTHRASGDDGYHPHQKGFLNGLFKRRSTIASSFVSLFWETPSHLKESTHASVRPDPRATNLDAGIGEGFQTRKPLPILAIPTLPQCEPIDLDFRTFRGNRTVHALQSLIACLVPRYIVREQHQENDASMISLLVLESGVESLEDESLFVVQIRSSVRRCDPTRNEKLLDSDPSRSSALTFFCANDLLELVLTKRNSKTFDSRISPPFPLFFDDDYDQVPRETVAFVSWVLKTHVVNAPNRQRLERRGVSPTRFLGSGSTATVCEGETSTTGLKVACKSVLTSLSLYEREVSLLRMVRGCDGLPNLIACFAETRTIVTEPVGMPLHRTRVSDFGSTRGRVFISVARGLEGLRSKGIVHRDVSPGNMILVNDPLTDELKLCLIDLGMAQRFSARERAYSGARSFASDRICEIMAREGRNKWTERNVHFGYYDDIESLIKSAVWSLDSDARRLVNDTAGSKRLDPQEVYDLWTRVWAETSLGRLAYAFLHTEIRKSPLGANTSRLSFNSPPLAVPLHDSHQQFVGSEGSTPDGAHEGNDADLYNRLSAWLAAIR